LSALGLGSAESAYLTFATAGYNNSPIRLNVFGYNDDKKEIIGPLFQSEVENPLHINPTKTPLNEVKSSGERAFNKNF